jgi:hypothetical protein
MIALKFVAIHAVEGGQIAVSESKKMQRGGARYKAVPWRLHIRPRQRRNPTDLPTAAAGYPYPATCGWFLRVVAEGGC